VTAVQSAVPSATVANKHPALIAGAGDRTELRIHSVGQVARHFIHGNEMKEGMLNRVSAVVRAYDPCLSCSTHADGALALEIALKGPGGEVLDRIG
jgi:NAD-reducing hydrogenase large subunit